MILTRNAGKELPRCLRSLDFVDEIVVLDSGSTDDTLAHAQAADARVFQSVDWPGFGAQRQRAQQYARGEWLLWIDADEVVTPELRQGILAAIDDAPPDAVYRVNRLSEFCGRVMCHSGWYPDRVVRLYRRREYSYDDARVHEKVHCPGATVRDLPGHLLHYTAGDLASYLSKTVRYAEDWAEDRARRGKAASLPQACLHGVAAFFRCFLLRRGFRDGGHGFLLAVITAGYTFNKYAALWLKRRR